MREEVQKLKSTKEACKGVFSEINTRGDMGVEEGIKTALHNRVLSTMGETILKTISFLSSLLLILY